MTSWGTPIGGLLALGLLAAFPLTLASLPDAPDLRVEIQSERPFLIRDDVNRPLPPSILLPIPTPKGLTVADSSLGPGLNFRTWGITYSHRWEREVTLPIVTGPFVREGQDVCGLTVRLGAGLFDTRGAGAGLEPLLMRHARGSFGKYIDTEAGKFFLPDLQSIQVWLEPRVEVLATHVVIRLKDRTEFNIQFDARVVLEQGRPVIRRLNEPFVQAAGATRERALEMGENAFANGATDFGCKVGGVVGCVGGALVGWIASTFGGSAYGRGKAVSKLKETVREKVDEALVELGLKLRALSEPWAPFPSAPNNVVQFRLSDAPKITPSGITLNLCTRVKVGGPKVDASIPGSLSTNDHAPTFPHELEAGSNIVELGTNKDALNQLLYFVWQSGKLRELGTSRSLRDRLSLPPDMSSLAFDFVGFEPGLPPTIMRGASATNAVGLTLGDVKVGNWGERRVVANALSHIGLKTDHGKIALSAAIDRLTANCTERSGAATALTPCVSDLMPTVRERLAERPLATNIEGGDLLSKLPTKSFDGGKVELSDLQADIDGNPVRLNIQVRAKLVSEP